MDSAPDRQRLSELLALADPSSGHAAEWGLQAARDALALARQGGWTEDAARAGTWLARHGLHLGRFRESLDQAVDILQQEASAASAEIRVEALCVLALAGSELADFERALDAAQELMELTSHLTDADTALLAAVSMAVCFERMGDSWQAVRLLSEALADHAPQASDRAVLTASNALCAVCPHVFRLLRDCDAEAERTEMLALGRQAGETALRLAQASANPIYAASVQVNLAEALIAQNELAVAIELLQAARDMARRQSMGSLEWSAEVNLAEARMRQGAPGEALQGALAVLTKIGSGEAAADQARAHEIAYRACKVLGDFEAALRHFEQAERLERLALTKHLRVQSRLLVTRSEERRAKEQAAHAQGEAQRQREAAVRLADDAEHDPLTRLGNRRLLDRRVAELLPQQLREQRPFAVAQIDVDHFKKVNDEYGHAAGDAALVALSDLLKKNSRSVDVLARNGGEEFVMVLPNTPQSVASEVCERLRALTESMSVELPGGGSLRITVSIGVAVAPPYDLPVLLRAADEALYAAKRSGRNRVCTATGGEA
ncbi:diguanylate cyclase [Variovorax sp. YR752]|uniref:GGDEF domain-containing protein n=1 Tax=Variovorax sp. YR752 TaxID=1884383 RepID=UPI0031376F60